MTDLPHHGFDESRSGLPIRTPWPPGFPPVVIHTTVGARDEHAAYLAAKSGDADAALVLVHDLVLESAVDELRGLVGGRTTSPLVLPVTALETTGFNAIPDAFAQLLARRLGWRISSGEIVQTNRVGHTRAKSFNRFVTPAAFAGPVESGGRYILVDDHVGIGGTLANLKGHVENSGGVVIVMTTLTESRDGRQIALGVQARDVLWSRYGQALENLWREQFGHGIDGLTNLEGAILCRELSLDAIRDRLAQAAIEVRRRGLDPVFRERRDRLIE